jgi:hypothetical protein
MSVNYLIVFWYNSAKQQLSTLTHSFSKIFSMLLLCYVHRYNSTHKHAFSLSIFLSLFFLTQPYTCLWHQKGHQQVWSGRFLITET